MQSVTGIPASWILSDPKGSPKDKLLGSPQGDVNVNTSPATQRKYAFQTQFSSVFSFLNYSWLQKNVLFST